MSELSPGLLAALALTAKHLEPMEPIVVPETFPTSVAPNPVVHKHLSKKTIRNRKREKIAAQSRKRNRRRK